MTAARSTTARLAPVIVALALTGCAGSAFVRQPDGNYGRESRSTMEQRAADALRRAGASTEAREAQKRAESTMEAERRSPGADFFADLMYAVFGVVLAHRTAGGEP